MDWVLGDALVSVRLLERLGASSQDVARGEKQITMHSLAVQAGVAATTITRLARNDDNVEALSLNLGSNIVTVLDCGIEDLLEAVEGGGEAV